MKVLAIDQGTTSTRAIIVTADAPARLLLSLPHRQSYPQPGWVEHDPEELITNLRTCLDAAGDVAGLGAVGIANQGESCLGWDAQTGRVLGPVIVWQDDRTAADVAWMREGNGQGGRPGRPTGQGNGRAGPEVVVRERAGLPLDPYFSASKLGWIMRTIPEAARLAKAGRLRLGTTDAFFRDRLTGRFETDVTTASRTSLMNLATCGWDPELCDLFGVPMEALPKIGASTGDFGTVTCGARRVPLMASIVDQQAALYGHGCRQAGDAKITFGTGAFALAVTGPALRRDADGPLPTVAWQKAGAAPVYALDGGVYAAASALNWARAIGLFDDFAEIGHFDAPAAIGRGLAFVPALAGLACPHWDRRARGAWMGLSLETEARDMVQAILEGVALRMAEVVARMDAVQPLAAPVSVDGGMTANPYFCQILADVLARPITVSDQPDLTALGAAALAAEAAGQPLPQTRSGRIMGPRSWPQGHTDTFRAARVAVQTYGARAD